MERHFDEELGELNEKIFQMSILVQEAIRKSTTALKNREKTQAQDCINADAAIDEMELAINAKCIDLIARYQPMAGDLRYITAAMKINSQLERIGDLAVSISRRVLDLADRPPLQLLTDITKLSETAHAMVRDSIEAFVKRDVQLSKKVVLSDPQANELRNQIQEELINEHMTRDAATAQSAVSMLLLARNLERICDHSVNIAGEIIFMVEARVIKHHREELR